MSTSDMIESPVRWLDCKARIRDVSMNTTAAMVVALLRNVDAPELPKRVWLDPPPKAAPMSAPLPVWSRTIMIRAIHTMTCMMINSTDTISLLLLVFHSS